MRFEKIQAGFPEGGNSVAEPLRRLCEFAEENEGEVSGSFFPLWHIWTRP